MSVVIVKGVQPGVDGNKKAAQPGVDGNKKAPQPGEDGNKKAAQPRAGAAKEDVIVCSSGADFCWLSGPVFLQSLSLHHNVSVPPGILPYMCIVCSSAFQLCNEE